MFPGGGMDDRKMQQMMKQMGIDMQELDAEEVVIRTPDEELVFTDADVQRMAAPASPPSSCGRDSASPTMV